MRVKWYGYKIKDYYGTDKDFQCPILEKDTSQVFEGEVVATVPNFVQYGSTFIQSPCMFVVLLDDGTFKEITISECELVKK